MTSDADSPKVPSEAEVPSETRFLILMRHAKSDWGDASLSDHDRPLNSRGQRDAPRMAAWLAESDLIPDRVLSSTSVRTRETIELMNLQWAQQPSVSFSESLYLSSPESIFHCILSDALDANRLMVLAHNPGISQLASVLAGRTVEMPTAAIAVFEVEIDDWSKLQRSTPMQMVYSMRPKSL